MRHLLVLEMDPLLGPWADRAYRADERAHCGHHCQHKHGIHPYEYVLEQGWHLFFIVVRDVVSTNIT